MAARRLRLVSSSPAPAKTRKVKPRPEDLGKAILAGSQEYFVDAWRELMGGDARKITLMQAREMSHSAGKGLDEVLKVVTAEAGARMAEALKRAGVLRK